MTEQMRRKKASNSVATLVTPRYHYGYAGGYQKKLAINLYDQYGLTYYKEVYCPDAHPCRYATKQDALKDLKKLYEMWTREHMNFIYPQFEDCIKETQPECREFNPLLNSVYLVIKPI